MLYPWYEYPLLIEWLNPRRYPAFSSARRASTATRSASSDAGSHVAHVRRTNESRTSPSI